MAQDKTIIRYDVQPIEPEGKLVGLRIQRYDRTTRETINGRVLNHGFMTKVGEPLDIPLNRLQDLVGELVNWLVYFASGEAERDV